MGLFEHQFPYTNFHEKNLDGIARVAGEAKKDAEEAKTKVDSYENRVTSLENVTRDIPNVKSDIAGLKQKDIQLDARIDGLQSELSNDEKDIADIVGNISDLDTRTTILEGAAGWDKEHLPVTTDKYEADQGEIKNEITNLYEIAASGAPVVINTFECGHASLIEVDEVGGDNWTIRSNEIEVVGYYHQLGALIVGEFLCAIPRIGGEILATTADKWLLCWKNSNDLPVPKSDIPQITCASGIIGNSNVNVGNMFKTNLQVRGNMHYYFADQHSDILGAGYKWVFNGVIRDIQRANEEMFRIPFTYVTNYKKSEWDYELHDEVFNYDRILRTELLLRSSENIDKPFYMEMELVNLEGKRGSSGTGSNPYIYGDGLIFNRLESYTSGNYEAHLYDTRESNPDIYKRVFMSSNAGTWKIVITRDSSNGTSCTSYLNGSLYATLSSTTYGINETRPFTIGGNYDDAQNTYAKFKLNYFKFKWL